MEDAHPQWAHRKLAARAREGGRNEHGLPAGKGQEPTPSGAVPFLLVLLLAEHWPGLLSYTLQLALTLLLHRGQWSELSQPR